MKPLARIRTSPENCVTSVIWVLKLQNLTFYQFTG